MRVLMFPPFRHQLESLLAIYETLSGEKLNTAIAHLPSFGSDDR